MKTAFRTHEEHILWSAFKQGDTDSFRILFDTYYPVLINYGHKFTRDLFILEESIQDLFVKLWNNKINLASQVVVKHYLFRSFRRILFRKINQHTMLKYERIDQDTYKFDFALSADDHLVLKEQDKELKQLIKKALSKLSSRQREAIYLRFFEELPYEQVADILKMNIGGTYKLVYRALDRLKEELGPVFPLLLLALTGQGTQLLNI
jgi:RNA polymerase sigma factor (sigma-70 family)